MIELTIESISLSPNALNIIVTYMRSGNNTSEILVAPIISTVDDIIFLMQKRVDEINIFDASLAEAIQKLVGRVFKKTSKEKLQEDIAHE